MPDASDQSRGRRNGHLACLRGEVGEAVAAYGELGAGTAIRTDPPNDRNFITASYQPWPTDGPGLR